MGMTPEREKEIRETLRGNTTSDYADTHALLQELDELRGKLLAFEQEIVKCAGDAEKSREHFAATEHYSMENVERTVAKRISKLFDVGVALGLFSDPLTKVPAPKPYIKPAMGFGASGLPEGFNDPVVQHFHDDPVFYANCPACAAGHAGVFNGEKGTDRKCEARWDGGRTHDCEVFPSQFKYPHCQVCGQHHEPPACTASQ